MDPEPGSAAQPADSWRKAFQSPAVSLPKGGGALRGIDETFQANPVTGSAGFSVPLPFSRGRSGFEPSLALSYDSGAGNGPFGLGWQLGIPSIRRRTDRGVPRYHDAEDSDTFVLSGAEDLVGLRIEVTGVWRDDVREESGYVVRRYRPRVESAFAQIERWTHAATGDTYWRTVTRDNVTRLYGRGAHARLADPDAPSRVFEWLLEEERDELGNVIAYEYASEDRAGVDPALPFERHRSDAGHRCAFAYPKRVRYGNETPGAIDAYHFELVFDYGEHDPALPQPEPGGTWPARQDVFSSFRAGFDVRCYRLCRRVLMFHRFAELGIEPALVRSVDFTYHESPIVSYLTRVTQIGYVRRDGGYEQQALPPVDYEYSAATIDETVHFVEGLDDLAAGPDPRRHQWVDLDAEGLAGLLAVVGPAWQYKANDGDAVLAPSRSIGARPSLGIQAGTTLTDHEGDGTLDLVRRAPGLSGYQRREQTGGWGRFEAFSEVPSLDWNDPSLRVMDVDGNGRADVLITEDEVLRWYPSDGRRGYGPSSWTARTHDEESGPALMFASDGESVFIGDMTGDGLSDIVRIRNGSVCYWPNRGHGRFGAKVVMSNAPRFDAPDAFDRGRLRLADIDGCGAMDLIYLGRDQVRIALNRSGNGYEDVTELSRLPEMDSVTDVSVADLLGDGTACLVWFSPLPQHAQRPMRYVHLMAEGKPHLLVRSVNNRGRETTLGYLPSTQFYLEDKKAGRPWITRLPFPVHVLERVEVRDHVTGWKFVTSYAYHHGYFDGEDREFRGFGLVEQFDTELFSDFAETGVVNADIAHHQPPVRIRSWFHTGAWVDGSRISRQFEDEYYAGDPTAALLPDTTLPEGLSTEEMREACRALKGTMLRQETYADDGADESVHPYSVAEHCFALRRLQPAGDLDRGAFQVLPGETLTWHYERDPDDPRVAHELALAHDTYGHVTCSAAVAYPRRNPSYDEQGATHIVVTEFAFINQDTRSDAYHLGAPCETRAWEVAGLDGDDAHPFSVDALNALFAGAVELPFELAADGTAVQKRQIAHQRQLYRADDLTSPLPLGEIATRAISYESYKLAHTDGLLPIVFEGRVTEAMLEDDAGYLRWRSVQERYATPVPPDQLTAEHAAGWWMPSGRVDFADPATAAERFFLPDKARSPFGAETLIGYDAHLLTATRIEDAVANITEAALDYRVLAPSLITDANANRTAVAFDALGRVTAQAAMGKDGAGEGDTLGDPTVRFEYETFRWMNEAVPDRVRTYARETHGDPATRWLTSVLYSDGSGNAVMTKAQAEPGLAPARDAGGALRIDASGSLVWEETATRWVGSGRTVVDNKGNPVKQYEPYFSSTDEYETETELVQWGVTPVLHYDPRGRNVRTDLPNKTLLRVDFDPWSQTTSDANDTVLESDWYRARVGGQMGADEQRAAELAAAHANTPAVVHLDTLGRPFLAVADNAALGSYETRTRLDVQGNTVAMIDALGRTVMAYDHDLLGGKLRSSSMDAGKRWTLRDVAGAPIYAWNAREHRLRTTSDALRRPTQVFLQEGNRPELLVARTIYGELQPAPQVRNLRGKVYQSFDGAGVVTTGAYDFHGNLLTSTRQLAADYTSTPDWSAAVAFDADVWSAATTYDALGRPVTLTTPDGSVIHPTYNDAALLEHIDVTSGGTRTTFVADINYDAKGQRELIDYGNGVRTVYAYDPDTFRLAHLQTSRGAQRMQDRAYTYDPVGNVTHIRDDAQQTIFFNNQVVEPHASCAYDALYRLIAADGREHVGQATQPETTWSDEFRVGLAHPHDGQAMRRYDEQYEYDAVGNILQLVHQATAGSWTRAYEYGEPSLVEPRMVNNRLSRTVVGSVTERYSHDTHGNMIAMPHLSAMRWNHLDQLAATARQSVTDGTPETTYYTYDSTGQRVRKVTERQAAPGATPARLKERIYLGGFEVYRQYDGAGAAVTLERETLHVVDGQHRVALVETRTLGDDGSPPQLVRYQLGNHLGSASLELDGAGEVISYEEYYSYGSTSYQAVEAGIRAAAKRYRYTGKERDEETGLAYHGARYYACWLGRWTSADPAGMRDGPNLYGYVGGQPLRLVDPTGLSGGGPSDDSSKQVWFSQSDAYHLPVTAGWKSRGINALDRLRLQTAVDMWGGPEGPIDAGHPKDTPFVLIRKGQTVRVYAQSAAENRSQATADRALADAARASGGFARVGGADTVAGRGGPTNPHPPGPPAVLTPKFLNRLLNGTPVISAPRPTLTLIGSSPGSMDDVPAAVDAQQHLPFGAAQQLQMPIGSGKSASAIAIAEAEATVSALAGEHVGLASVSSATSARAGNATFAATRAVLPEVAAVETALTVGAMHAYAADYTALGTLLEGGAAAMPAVGAGLVAGILAGNAGEQTASALGASPVEAIGTGAVTAFLAGAGAGALIGSAGLGVTAVPGAAIGGVVGLVGYGLSKFW